MKQQKEVAEPSPKREEVKQVTESEKKESSRATLSQEFISSLVQVAAKVETTPSPKAKPSPKVKKPVKRPNRMTKTSNSKNSNIQKAIIEKNKASAASFILKLRKTNKFNGAKKLLLIKNLRAAAMAAAAASKGSTSTLYNRVKKVSKPAKLAIVKGDEAKNEMIATTVEKPQTEIVEDEDDLPLAKLIEMKRLELTAAAQENGKEKEKENEQVNEKETNETETPVCKSIETQDEKKSSDQVRRQPATTDELMQKLNNTPTTSILKRKLLSKVGDVSPMLSVSLISSQCTEVNCFYIFSRNYFSLKYIKK